MLSAVRQLVFMLLILTVAIAGAPCDPGTGIERVSVTSSGGQATDDSQNQSISADGRFVVFTSWAPNLVPGDTNNVTDVFVRDRLLGTTERVSVSSSEHQANDWSGADNSGWHGDPQISADGRFVAFSSNATNLVAGDTNGDVDVFVRDRQSGTTEIVSVLPPGEPGSTYRAFPSMSADGRFIAFWAIDIFVRDRLLQQTEKVSVSSSGEQANSWSDLPATSGDGRFVTFSSYATNLVAGDTNGTRDIFLHDRQLGTTERISVSSSGEQANNDGAIPGSFSSCVSPDGRFVAFDSYATNLVAGDTNRSADVFVRDRLQGTTECVDISSSGSLANEGGAIRSMSADGRLVAFGSWSINLVPGDTNNTADVFVRDRQLHSTDRISMSSSGEQANDFNGGPSLSADGRYIAFHSAATNLIPGDTNGCRDVLVVTLAPPGGIPIAPTSLRAATVSQSQIDLTWIDNSDDETSFEIERDGIVVRSVGANTTRGAIPRWGSQAAIRAPA